MTQLQGVGDRRQETRFEIVGDLWATLEATQSTRLINIGPGGLLVEVPEPPLVGSVRQLRLTLADDVIDVTAVVRHVASSRPNRYMVGMAFVCLSPDTQKRLALLATAVPEPQTRRPNAWPKRSWSGGGGRG